MGVTNHLQTGMILQAEKGPFQIQKEISSSNHQVSGSILAAGTVQVQVTTLEDQPKNIVT